MCLLALLYQQIPDAPLAIAANREEFFDRPFLPPRVAGTRCRYLAGIDQRAGGTWLGVNERGLVVAVTNRPKAIVPERPRSRGLLTCDLLEMTTIADAAAHLRRELVSGHYAGANFLLAAANAGLIFEAGDTLCETPLRPGLHLVTNGPANDPADSRQQLAREMFAAAQPKDTASFLEIARRVCRQGPDAAGRSIIVRRPERGTVSSTLLAVTNDPAHAVCQFAPRAPDMADYEDYSAVLRGLLTGREE
ncbi:MAG TPA: NRDE family protein [Pirellulales bacterium]|nr:NRDE family protein [Pirellulales bacterium]